ncbi:MAG: universal stress protein [Fuerstiella sp.]|nr:universal stress protein [Fuerstiella sp.]MCP4855854.1 universal stress protein [Fuerstiella sp.]
MINIKRILVPTDFSEPGKTALTYAVAFADQFGAAVNLMHVIEPIPPSALLSHLPKEEFERNMRDAAETQMEELHAEWEDYAFPVNRIIVEGHPFVEIIRNAKESNADLIVMGTHGRGAIAHILLGSVAEKVVRKAPCPVLTVRHPEHEFVIHEIAWPGKRIRHPIPKRLEGALIWGNRAHSQRMIQSHLGALTKYYPVCSDARATACAYPADPAAIARNR